MEHVVRSSDKVDALPIARKKAYDTNVTERYALFGNHPEVFRVMPQNRHRAWLQRRSSAQSLALVCLVLIDGGGDAEYIDYRLRRNHDL